jgi:hypothetical protein
MLIYLKSDMKMTKKQTIDFLINFNKWRRGSETIKQPNPREIGIAIDNAIKFLKQIKENNN